MEGSILLHRSLLDSYAFANEKTLKIWIWLLLKAKYKDGFVNLNIGNTPQSVKVNRGQLIFGRFKAEDELNIPGSTIYRHLQKLEEQKQIKIEVNSHFSVVTICKYDSYQTKKEDSEQQVNSRRTAGEQQADTYNKVNKDNKVNREARAKNFYDELKGYVNTYPKEMLRAFYNYWTELNKSGTKMRFELEQTWETSKRLNTWASREKVKTQTQQAGKEPTTEQIMATAAAKLKKYD